MQKTTAAAATRKSSRDKCPCPKPVISPREGTAVYAVHGKKDLARIWLITGSSAERVSERGRGKETVARIGRIGCSTGRVLSIRKTWIVCID